MQSPSTPSDPPDQAESRNAIRKSINDEIRKLEAKDLLLLKRYAQLKMYGIAGRVRNADARDLLHEAIRRTLDGTREWKPQETDFVTHLKQAMSSIAYDWYRRAAHPMSLLTHDWHSAIRSRHPSIPPPIPELREDPRTNPDMEREIMAQDAINSLRKRFKGDAIAVLLLEMWKEGYSGPDIQRLLDIEVNTYDAARRRIARALKTYGEKVGEHE